MNSILVIYILASGLITLVLCLMLSKISPKLRLLDYPNNRKLHSKPIPLVGGISIISTFIIFTSIFSIDSNFKIIIYSSLIVLFFGLIDDIFDIGITIRLIAQFVSCLIIIETGLKIIHLGYYQFLPHVELGYLSILITFICVVGLTNAFNFIDGIDGFCSSQVIISLFSLIILSFNKIDFLLFNLILILIFCTSVSFVLNLNIFSKIQIFLGDSGSTTLGFLVAWFLIYFSIENYVHEALIIWCVTLPVFDMFRVIFQRISNKKNPFKPDRTHIHHLLLLIGYSNKLILFITIFYSILSSFIGYLVFRYMGPDYNIILYIIWFLVYFTVTNYLIGRK